MTMRKILGTLVLMIGSAAIGAAIYGTFFQKKEVYYYQSEPMRPMFSNYFRDTVSQRRTGESPDFAFSVNQARPAVVHVKSSYGAVSNKQATDFFINPWHDYFDDDYSHPHGEASGSGVIISADGYIITNNHVIEDASKIEISMLDNRTYTAELIGADVNTDLALLKIDAEDLPHLSFGNSDEVEVGQWVLAVGNPLDLNFTVTAGIVSAKGRNMNLLGRDSKLAIESFIQTDAAVNRGNSGGALVNIKGELIGINTAIASRTGFYAGYSFAIPSSIARKVMEDLLMYGEVKRGILGVIIRQVDGNLNIDRDNKGIRGAYITEIDPGSGADEAGLEVGDVIIAVNEIVVHSSQELQEQVSRYRPGEKIQVKVFRDYQEKDLMVVLKPLDGDFEFGSERTRWKYKNSRFRILRREEMMDLDLEYGVVVEHAGRKLAEAGITDGFVITEINNKMLRSLSQLESYLRAEIDMTIKGVYRNGTRATFEIVW